MSFYTLHFNHVSNSEYKVNKLFFSVQISLCEQNKSYKGHEYCRNNNTAIKQIIVFGQNILIDHIIIHHIKQVYCTCKPKSLPSSSKYSLFLFPTLCFPTTQEQHKLYAKHIFAYFCGRVVEKNFCGVLFFCVCSYPCFISFQSLQHDTGSRGNEK